MSRRRSWLALGASLGLFAAAATGPAASPARASDCFLPGSTGTLCAIIQHCDLYHCHYHTYVIAPPCRPSGPGPDCGITE